MKAPVEQPSADALNELENVIEAKPNLLQLFGRIDELGGQLPPSADSELRHFLQRKSYEKAGCFWVDATRTTKLEACQHV
jgi:hypothetical protein